MYELFCQMIKAIYTLFCGITFSAISFEGTISENILAFGIRKGLLKSTALFTQI